jgi:HAD superfamily hydrolase (TIGR01509 family)
MGPSSRYQAILLDWRGTLAFHNPYVSWWIERALRSIGRPVDTRAVTAARAGWLAAAALPEVLQAEARIDCSAAFHRSATMHMFELAGLDAELAEALYRLDAEPACNPLCPDVPGVLAAIHDLGVTIVLVSDIHFDVRPTLAAQGIGELIDAYVLSFEHGVQKPDPRIFAIALEAVGAEPEETLMVGDRASSDGDAAAVGIATLILPLLAELAPRGLEIVLGLLAA